MFTVFVNFWNFTLPRAIRNDICYHNANVVVTIVGAGLAYGLNGYTHFGIEDLAAMLPLPKMKVFSPADNFELDACMSYIKKILVRVILDYLREENLCCIQIILIL